MKKEDKELILKDISGRLVYNVKCYIPESNEVKILGAIQEDGENTLFDFWEDESKKQYQYQLYISEFKPYLLPLSSMTDEQKREFLFLNSEKRQETGQSNLEIIIEPCRLKIDWLDKNHFDYRDLIPKDLALDATGLDIY
jgi:hypothetical protein